MTDKNTNSDSETNQSIAVDSASKDEQDRQDVTNQETATEATNQRSVTDRPESRRDVVDGKAVFSVQDLDVYYGDDQALDDVTIDIPEGEVTALIGPSGCGKSTFLRCLNRMNDEIDAARIEGSIQLGDEEIYREDIDLVELRRRVGMVFQQPNPFPKPIRENIAYAPRKHGDIGGGGLLSRLLGRSDREKADELVERTLKRAALWDEVKDRLDQSALGLSGGQQQRLCIARALAVDPDVLLMDEPASALDPVATSQIEDLIEELRGDYTVIIVTHNMQQAARISDKTAVFLTGGELVEFDDTDKIFEDPESQRVEDYITGKFG